MQAGARLISCSLFAALTLAACGGGGGGDTLPAPGPSGGPGGPSGPPTVACSTTNSSPQSFLRASSGSEHIVGRPQPPAPHSVQYIPGTIEVIYKAGSGLAPQTFQRAGMNASSELRFDRLNRAASVVRVSPGSEAAAIAKLRATPGVVEAVQARYEYRHGAQPYLPNDPYFNRPGGAPPFYQTPSQYGQWDMHLTCVSRAWGYGKGLGSVNAPGATGGNATIAIIDTGLDTTHPDISPKLANYSAVYDLGNGQKNASESMHDPDGHGTNVAGIAAAATDDNFGFVGAGFNAKIMPFKVFPDPTNSTASSTDVAAAINDAVAHHVQVISMSLGSTPSSGTCQNGGEDPVQGQAVANAVAAGIVVVASSGNETSGVLDCPGGDQNVIAVGASALNDSVASNIFEYVASYSNYDKSNSQWGVVAPGGDPSGSSDADNLHWIVNAWTNANSSYCTTDPFGASNDCREAIAGTSQAAPHVAGIAALLQSATGNTLTPQTIRTVMCQTSQNINDAKQGCGRVDAYRAMARVLGDSSVQ